MGEYVVLIQDGGLVQIPPDLSREMNLAPGDRLVMYQSGDHIEVERVSMSMRDAAEQVDEARRSLHDVEDRTL